MFNHIKLEDKLPELEAETLSTGRTYKTPDGNKYPSVTTVLGEEGKAGILAWRKRVGEEEANRISFQASSRGTSVHTLAENYINNDPEWSKGAMPTTIVRLPTSTGFPRRWERSISSITASYFSSLVANTLAGSTILTTGR